MSTQRYIATSIWTDEWFGELDPHKKLTYFYLLTNPFTNVAGVYQLNLRYAAADLGLSKDEIVQELLEFEEDGKAYYRDGWVILPRWPKHQKFGERSKMALGMKKILTETAPSWLQQMIQSGEVPYDFPLDQIWDGKAIDKIADDSDSDIDSDIDIDSDREKYAERVFLTTSQYSALVEQWGEACIKDYIQRVSDYQLSHGRRYKDAAAAIRNFIRKDIERNTFKYERHQVAKPKFSFSVSDLGGGA